MVGQYPQLWGWISYYGSMRITATVTPPEYFDFNIVQPGKTVNLTNIRHSLLSELAE